jgi:hypothetical protein
MRKKARASPIPFLFSIALESLANAGREIKTTRGTQVRRRNRTIFPFR